MFRARTGEGGGGSKISREHVILKLGHYMELGQSTLRCLEVLRCDLARWGLEAVAQQSHLKNYGNLEAQ